MTALILSLFVNLKEKRHCDALQCLLSFSRLKALLEGTKGNIFFGGEMSEEEKYIEPTIITDVKPDDKLMQEEVGHHILISVLKAYW